MPIPAAFGLEQHDRMEVALARLNECQQLERLVLGSESAREQGEGVGLLHEHELAGEEVLEVDQPALVDVGVGLGLERQADVDAEAMLQAGAPVARFHDPGSRSRHDHPSVSARDLLRELAGEGIVRVVLLGSGGPEQRDLGDVPVLREDEKRISHLLQCGVDELEVSPFGVVAKHFEPGHQHLGNEIVVVLVIGVAVGTVDGVAHERIETRIEIVYSEPVAAHWINLVARREM